MYRGDQGGSPLTLQFDGCSGQTLFPNQLCYAGASTGGDLTGAMSCSVILPGSVKNFRATLELRDATDHTLVQEPLR